MKPKFALATLLLCLPIELLYAESYQLTLKPGDNFVANQLNHPGSNGVNLVFPTVPVNSEIRVFNELLQDFELVTESFLGASWSPGTAVLNPGTGFVFVNPGSADVVVTINGTPNIPVLPVALPGGVRRLLSRQTNAVGTFENIIGTSPMEGTEVHRWDANVFDLLTNRFTAGVWVPATPVLAVGESAFFLNPAGGNSNGIPPSLTGRVECLNTFAGSSNACISVTATGSPPLSYFWFRNGALISSVTGPVYCLTNAQAQHAGNYTVVVSNSVGVVTGSVAQVSVMPQTGPILGTFFSPSNGVCLTVQTYVGLVSLLEFKNTLTDAVWTARSSIVGDGSLALVCDGQPTNTSRFYRLRLAPALETFGGLYVSPEFTSTIGDPTSACGCASPGVPSGSAVGGSAQDNAMGNLLLHTGEFTQRAVDLAVPGRGFNWRFERAYRSGWSYAGPLGYNWDFNYNRRLFIKTNADALRLDGLGRADLFARNGTKFDSPAGIYNILTNHPNGTFEELEPHGTRWFYSAPNCFGVAALAQVVDRYSNALRFHYNSGGQLTNATDSTGRAYSYQYDAHGRLVRVEDFTHRGVTYTYDDNGDLAAVTSPPVSGTPTGNNFLTGITVRYAYTNGFFDSRLNHNLVAVTAPNQAESGSPRLTVAYDTNPGSTNVDRVLAIGMSGTISYGYSYLGTNSHGDFTNAVFQSTVTNRNGNVAEYRFNQLGNIVRSIRFTQDLRPGEPDGYTNYFAYSADGELLRRTNAEGDFVVYSYDSGSLDRRRQGNLLGTTRFPGPRGGDQTSIGTSATYTNFNLIASSTQPNGTTSYTYDQFGNATNIVYPDGGVESYQYDAFGRMTEHVFPQNATGHRRRDTMSYTTNGYLTSRVVDAGGFNLTTTYEYDSFGNLIRTIDPRGNDATNIVNALNQTVRSLGRQTTNGSGIRYQSDTIYDANGNVVRTDYENRDETGSIVSSNALISTSYT